LTITVESVLSHNLQGMDLPSLFPQTVACKSLILADFSLKLSNKMPPKKVIYFLLIMNAKNPWHEAAPRQATGNKNRKKCQKTVTSDTRAGQDSSG
jgi:hypothetical protein